MAASVSDVASCDRFDFVSRRNRRGSAIDGIFAEAFAMDHLNSGTNAEQTGRFRMDASITIVVWVQGTGAADAKTPRRIVRGVLSRFSKGSARGLQVDL